MKQEEPLLPRGQELGGVPVEDCVMDAQNWSQGVLIICIDKLRRCHQYRRSKANLNQLPTVNKIIRDQSNENTCIKARKTLIVYI